MVRGECVAPNPPPNPPNAGAGADHAAGVDAAPKSGVDDGFRVNGLLAASGKASDDVDAGPAGAVNVPNKGAGVDAGAAVVVVAPPKRDGAVGAGAGATPFV